LCLNGGNEIVGLRFNYITIEPGAIIIDAYLQFTVDETTSEATTLLIEGEASDHAATFVDSTSNISSRPRTVADATWSPPPWPTAGVAGPDQQTDSLAAVINEIVNRAGWINCNSLVLMISGSGKRVAGSAAVLHISFDDPGGNRRPVVAAGRDQVLSLPNDTLNLDGTVTDDGLPEGEALVTLWSHVGGSGLGAITFATLFRSTLP
jgi:hypothetical protein